MVLGLYRDPCYPGVRACPGNPSHKTKSSHAKTESESADETVRAGTGLALSPIFWEGKSKGVVFGVRERTVTGSDYSIALAPSQHV